MSARFFAYPPDSAALVRVLDEDKSYRIGRSDNCELRIDHPSISRIHADLLSTDEGWQLRDAGSKNGVRLDGHPVTVARFKKHAWFAVGDVYCSIETLDASAISILNSQVEERRAVSRSMQARIAPALGIRTLIPQTLDVFLELSGLERGFVLYAPLGQPLRVCASRHFTMADLVSPHFDGSASAIERAVVSHKSVICCDTADSPWLGARPSVQLGGIRALVCVPLRVSDNTFGVIYADSAKPGMLVTELDLELLEGVAEHAAAALDAHRLSDQMENLENTAPFADSGTTRWDAIRAA